MDSSRARAQAGRLPQSPGVYRFRDSPGRVLYVGRAVSLRRRVLSYLRTQFGRHCHTDGEPAHGRARVRLAAPTPLDIARHLAGWGAMIEVLEPPSVQAELARIGAELVGRYTGARSPDRSASRETLDANGAINGGREAL